MEEGFKKERYFFGKGCSISHTYGKSAGRSTLSFSHYTTSCMFLYFISGCANIKVEGGSYDINEGDIILVNPSELYMCEIFASSFHERIVIRVDHSIMDNFSDDASELIIPFFKREKGVGNYIPSKSAKEMGVNKIFGEIFTMAKQKLPEKNVLAVCKTMELLANLKGQIAHADKKLKRENPLINKVLVYINENFYVDLSIPYLAEKFNVNESYLAHLFKEYVGISPWNYIISKRLNYFNSLLSQGVSIEAGYVMAGFQNYSNFFRLYKKYMNMTPSEFKRRQSVAFWAL